MLDPTFLLKEGFIPDGFKEAVVTFLINHSANQLAHSIETAVTVNKTGGSYFSCRVRTHGSGVS